jgi:guanylate kinase
MDTDGFENLKECDEFAEWAMVHGNYYGTLKRTIEENLSKERT